MKKKTENIVYGMSVVFVFIIWMIMCILLVSGGCLLVSGGCNGSKDSDVDSGVDAGAVEDSGLNINENARQCEPKDLLSGGGLEDGTPNPYWKELSTHFGTPLCDVFLCGNGGGTVTPRTGLWFLWFGGVLGKEVASVGQSVEIGGGPVMLSFYLYVPYIENEKDNLKVYIDGKVVFKVDGQTADGYKYYELVLVDISQYKMGKHAITFEGNTRNKKEDVSSFIVDDIRLIECANSYTWNNG